MPLEYIEKYSNVKLWIIEACGRNNIFLFIYLLIKFCTPFGFWNKDIPNYILSDIIPWTYHLVKHRMYSLGYIPNYILSDIIPWTYLFVKPRIHPLDLFLITYCLVLNLGHTTLSNPGYTLLDNFLITYCLI